MHDSLHNRSSLQFAKASDRATSPVQARGLSRTGRLALIITSTIALAGLAHFLLTVYVLFNLNEVVPNQVYRSSQPSPAFLATLVREKQLRSVIKLNSQKESDWSSSEETAASRLGIQLIHIGIGVSELPSRHKLIEIVNAVDAAPRPVLIHCKTGADRTGVVSAMVRMREGDSFDRATAAQLSLRYFHVGHVGEDVGDLFEQYRADRAAAGLPTGGWPEFKAYVLNDYYPNFYNADIRPAVLQVQGPPGARVSLDVTVTNRSPRAWPARDDQPFRLMLGRAPAVLARVPVPAPGAGQSVTLSVRMRVPKLPPGTYEFPFDIAHGTTTWFALRGSAITPVTVTVHNPSLARSDDVSPQL